MRAEAAWLMIFLLTGARLDGQTASPLVTHAPTSARALALGGILPPGSSDAAGLFEYAAFPAAGISGALAWNGTPRPSTRMPDGPPVHDTTALQLAGEVEWLGGFVGLGVRSSEYTAGCRCAYPAIYTSPPPVPVSERMAHVTYGRMVRGIRLAVSGDYLDQRWDFDRGTGWSLGLSAGLPLGPLRLAAAAQNLGPALNVGDVSVPLGRRLAVAAAPVAGLPLGPFDLLATVQAAWAQGDRFQPAAGVELGYYAVMGRTFFLRGGLRRPDPAAGSRVVTAGAGFSGDRIGIDYAYVPLQGGRAEQSIGLRWRLSGR